MGKTTGHLYYFQIYFLDFYFFQKEVLIYLVAVMKMSMEVLLFDVVTSLLVLMVSQWMVLVGK